MCYHTELLQYYWLYSLCCTQGSPTYGLWTATSCQICSIIRLEIKCTINVMCMNQPETILPWSVKNCLPWNQSLVPKRWRTTAFILYNWKFVLQLPWGFCLFVCVWSLLCQEGSLGCGTKSLVVALRLLRSMQASIVAARRLSCSAACGILVSHQGIEPECLALPGRFFFFFLFYFY